MRRVLPGRGFQWIPAGVPVPLHLHAPGNPDQIRLPRVHRVVPVSSKAGNDLPDFLVFLLIKSGLIFLTFMVSETSFPPKVRETGNIHHVGALVPPTLDVYLFVSRKRSETSGNVETITHLGSILSLCPCRQQALLRPRRGKPA